MSIINDIKSELKELKQEKSDLVKYAITMTIALAIFGILAFFIGKHTIRAYVLWSIGGVFLILGLIVPKLLKPIHYAWMGLAYFLGWIVSRVLLTLLFILSIAPVGIFLRLWGKDPLQRKIDKNAT